ncbi:MAG: F420-0:Gamma-glutamyl ligase [Pelotomaculum sp. PtaB.Bin013]|uniref:Coenzyme F420-0:L-glutamate ligase n=1 Tax=Pelotomaculum isophthalicicum JI TaxID=947010 RepID=A0A9X4H4A6_9FIRM|nr:coenzyme F420-0:L-glutamate ligase [Pelotomaculum isophthalicicum]MDF9408583.1 coenzyme F420-0:L-glutamate ligase [Pelotomaculum isophthalicicum JI]OPX81782.1 MAG: F420-0:Gamma-glutamyl ligase [Pelotomaculum sp. PtaB.Bin013]
MILGRIPIRTHIITEKDDMVDVVKKYTGEVAEKGDIIAMAESVVAITQGRAILPDTINPGLLAKFLCLFPGKDGSLATPRAMQLAIQEVGKTRIMLGAIAAVIGRIIRRKGDFYRIAGRQLAQIDDVAGTMWPFEKHIILGPKNPHDVVRKIKDVTGVEAVITDVNDIRKVDILAASEGVDQNSLIKDLEDNPFGNDDQQTPIIVLKMAKNNP